MITLKGMHGFMIRCVIPEEIPAGDLPAEFARIMKDGRTMLSGSRVVLDFGERPLDHRAICSVLTDFVFPSGIKVAAWMTYDAASQDAMKRAGLPTVEPAQGDADDGDPSVTPPGALISRTLRSGQRVEHIGDVIINGHVNGGAEIYATGNVTVIGRLRGTVHAGWYGSEEAAVVARSLEAPQLRIAGHFASIERDAPWWGRQVIASIKGDDVLIDYWPGTKTEE